MDRKSHPDQEFRLYDMLYFSFTDAKMFLHLLNAHVLMGRPLTPLRKDVGVLWHARLIISALVMPSAMADLAHVLNPMLAPIARTLVTRLLVFPMLSVLFKLAFLCVDACQDSNCYPSKELVLVRFLFHYFYICSIFVFYYVIIHKIFQFPFI